MATTLEFDNLPPQWSVITLATGQRRPDNSFMRMFRLCRFLSVTLTVSVASLPGTPTFGFDLLRPDLWLAPHACESELPRISVGSSHAEISLDHSGNHEDIEATARTLRGAVLAGWRTNGLASANLRTEGQTTVRLTQLADGSWCGTLNEADFLISYEDPLRIFITRDYAEGTCQYRAILAHELQHVDIYREVLDAHLQGADARLAEYMLAMGPVYGATSEDVSQQIETRVGQAASDLADGVATEARTRNAALDTPQNYLRVQSECPGW